VHRHVRTLGIRFDGFIRIKPEVVLICVFKTMLVNNMVRNLRALSRTHIDGVKLEVVYLVMEHGKATCNCRRTIANFKLACSLIINKPCAKVAAEERLWVSL
jgi:hypothetical protein